VRFEGGGLNPPKKAGSKDVRPEGRDSEVGIVAKKRALYQGGVDATH